MTSNGADPAVLVLDSEMPTRSAISANASAMVRYAALCQEASILPIVDPDVLMVRSNSIQDSSEVTEEVLRTVCTELRRHSMNLQHMILKPNMVAAGLTNPDQGRIEEITRSTVQSTLRSVSAAVPGITFLSGGQQGERELPLLNTMNAKFRSNAPWPLTFSFGRSIQHPALAIWHGEDKNIEAAQRPLMNRAAYDRAARRGEYIDAMEGKR